MIDVIQAIHGVLHNKYLFSLINHTRRFPMKKSLSYTVVCLFALLLVAGCASTKVTSQQRYQGGNVPRPDQIWVYDFAATAADVPAESALTGQHSPHPTPQTDEHIADGRKAGAEIATELAKQIHAMGLPAMHATAQAKPQINDILIKGYLLSITEGSASERVAIGFGAGNSELKTAVEVFQMTPKGLRKLGSETMDSTGSKTPGGALGVATLLATHNPLGLIVSSGVKAYGEVSGRSTIEGRAEQTAKEIADQLRPKFEEQGWVYPATLK